MLDDIEIGQIWRKLGPFDWIQIDAINDPNYPDYDGGKIGCFVTYLPPQIKPVFLKSGVVGFIEGSDWEDRVREKRFLVCYV